MTGVRWLRFNLVGLGGFLLQLAVLHVCLEVGWHYLAATAAAVQTAILHNFLWHQRWTWKGRGRHSAARRLLRFNLAAAAVSLVGNLVVMSILVGRLGLPALPANVVAVAACALVNFLVSDRWVFRTVCESPSDPTSGRRSAALPRGPSGWPRVADARRRQSAASTCRPGSTSRAAASGRSG